jgi:hypothetical protein
MFEGLKGLLQAGPAAVPKPEPKPVVVATAPVAEVFEPEIIAAPPEPEIVEAPAPSPVVAKIRIEPEIVPFSSVPVAPAAAPESVKLYDATGAFRAILKPSGEFVAVTTDKTDPLAYLSVADRRPIDWIEEQKLDLPMRSAGRIQFLLQFETEAQRNARIANDHGRALTGREVVQRDPEKSAAAQAVQQWRQ